VLEFTVAIAVELLLHKPPVAGSVNVRVRPGQTVAGPDIEDTAALTVTG
jgi:hypothetical protein